MNHALILDQIRLPEVTDTLTRLAPDVEPMYLYDTTRYEPLKAQSPLMVSCEINDALYQHWKGDALWQSSGVLIRWRDASQNDIVHHLRSLLWVNTPQSRPVLFRYYSPRLLNVWGPLLTDEERTAFLGPLSQCHSLEGDGKGSIHKAEDAPWFILSEQQIQTMDKLVTEQEDKETADV